MSVGDAVALSALTLGAAVAPLQVLKLWRHTTTAYDRKPGRLNWNDATWQGVVRALPVLAAACMFLIIAGWLVEITNHGVAMAAAATVFFLMLAAVCLGATIMLWNRPNALVPPDRRDERGILASRDRPHA